MTEYKYAVVKTSLQMCFMKFHDSKEEAYLEAERLCKKEETRFFVLKLVGYVDVKVAPIERVEFE